MISHQNNPTPSFLTMSFDMITVRFGKADEAVDVPAHRELLSAVSTYFQTAFEDEFKEATERTISLTDVTWQTFRIFLQWAYAQMYSYGSGVSIPDRTIFSHTTTDPGVNTSDPDPSEYSDSLEELNDYHPWNGTLVDEDLCWSHSPLGKNLSEHMRTENETWHKNYAMGQLSYLNVYIFAHKYSVHQLRDDILTAMVSQALWWRWFPNVDQDMLTIAYNNLFESATFHQFMAQSVAHFWLTEPHADLAPRPRTLYCWQPSFAVECSIAQAHTLQNCKQDNDSRHPRWTYVDCVKNSCVYHEHLVHDKAACRKRIRDKAHIHVVLINACAQDGIAMAQEQEIN